MTGSQRTLLNDNLHKLREAIHSDGGRKGIRQKEGRSCRKKCLQRGLEGSKELPAYPNLGVQLGCFLTQLEVENAVALAIILHSTQDITCLHFLSLGYNDRR